MKRSVKSSRLVALILGVVFILMLSGCNRTEPEDRAFPMAMGLGFKENAYTLYLAMPKLEQFAGDSAQPEESALLWQYESDSVEDLFWQVCQSQQQYLDLGHVQAVILEETLVEKVFIEEISVKKTSVEKTNIRKTGAEESGLDHVLNYLQNQPSLGGNAYVFITEELQSIMEENGKSMNSLGEYLMGLVDKQQEKPRTLQEVYNTWYTKHLLPLLYQVIISKEGITLQESV